MGIALQRGSVTEVMRACRCILEGDGSGIVSPGMRQWLQRCGPVLRQRTVPVLRLAEAAARVSASSRFCRRGALPAHELPVSSRTPVLAVAFASTCVYTLTAEEGLVSWALGSTRDDGVAAGTECSETRGKGVSRKGHRSHHRGVARYVRQAAVREPDAYFSGVQHASMACIAAGVSQEQGVKAVATSLTCSSSSSHTDTTDTNESSSARHSSPLHHDKEDNSSCATLAYGGVFVMTDCMMAAGVAVAAYSAALRLCRVYRYSAMPREVRGPHDSHTHVPRLMCYTDTETPLLLMLLPHQPHESEHNAPTSLSPRAGDALRLVCFPLAHFPRVWWSHTLVSPMRQPSPSYFTAEDEEDDYNDECGLQHERQCLLLRRGGRLDLGCPAIRLGRAAGHVTIELWVMLHAPSLAPNTTSPAATHASSSSSSSLTTSTVLLYQHGDVNDTGEVFLEVVRADGAGVVLRGGYRHRTRGVSVATAPLPPTAYTQWTHLTLIFDGVWRLLIDAAEVSRVGDPVVSSWSTTTTMWDENEQRPHAQRRRRRSIPPPTATATALVRPLRVWRVGAVGLVAMVRIWRVGRSVGEVQRDVRRALPCGTRGLVCQLLCNEGGGNVVYNYAGRRLVQRRHAVAVGPVSHVLCTSNYPLRCAESRRRRREEGFLGETGSAAAGWMYSHGVSPAMPQALASRPSSASLLVEQNVSSSSSQQHTRQSALDEAVCFCVADQLVVVTPVRPEEASYTRRKGASRRRGEPERTQSDGRVFTCYHLHTGRALHGQVYVPRDSASGGLMGSDEMGRVYELRRRGVRGRTRRRYTSVNHRSCGDDDNNAEEEEGEIIAIMMIVVVVVVMIWKPAMNGRV